MNQRTGKLMIMHKALHPRDDVNRLYVSTKEGRRGLASIEESIDALIWWLEDYREKCGKRLISATWNKTENTRINRIKTTKKQKWEEKQLWRYFKWQTSNISHEKTLTWLKKGKPQEQNRISSNSSTKQSIRTTCIEARIDKTQQNSKCWLCGDRDEMINHMISKCSKLL